MASGYPSQHLEAYIRINIGSEPPTKIEPDLRKVRGYHHLKEPREAMKDLNRQENIIKVA